jgi:TP901 family phage tail tape measure protein
VAESSVRIMFLGDSAGAVRSVRSIESAFGGLGRAAKLAGTAMTVGIVGGFVAATKAALDFDRSMRNVNSIAKLSERAFQSVSKQVLAMAKTTGQAPKQLADGLYDIVSSGFKATDGLKILKASAIAATAGMTDTATAVKAVTAVLNTYHEGADQAGKVSDILFQTVNKGVLTFEELASQIGDVLPLAGQLGVPLEDIGAAFATITLHGVNAAEAATQIKQVMVSMLKPSDALKKTLHDMGFESGETAIKQLGLEGVLKKLSVASHGSAKAFADWFPNVRAMNGALGLTGKNTKTLHENIIAMDHSLGATNKAFAEQSKSISVQWQKAKAGLIAAAIPIGQLLFPALAKGAAKVQEFAQGIQSHMPEIKAQFQDLSRIIGEVGGAIGRIAISPAGSAALLGGLAAVGTGKAIINVKEAITALGPALGALGPFGLAAAAGVGLFTASLILSARQARVLSGEVHAARDAIHGFQNASSTAKNAQLQLQQAQIDVQVSANGVKVAERGYQQAVRQSGRESDAARNAFLALRQARVNHRRAIEDETAAERNATTAGSQERAAKQKQAQALNALQGKARDLEQAYNRLSLSQHRNAAAGEAQDHALTASNAAMKSELVSAYAAAIGQLTRALGGTKAQAQEAASAVQGLASALGRLPTRKEVNIFIRTFRTGSFGAAESNRSKGQGSIQRAAGGMVPLDMGERGRDSVPAMLTPGEMVLNQAQQTALGGTAYLAQIFGFSAGGVVPGVQFFAAGGIASGPRPIGFRPRRRHPGSSPPARRGHRARRTGNFDSRVAAMSARITGVDDDIEATGREYSELADRYSVDDRNLQFIGTNPDGTEYVDQAAVDQRSNEIQKLLAKDEELRALYERKARLLAQMIALLIQAIRAAEARIKEEKRRIAADQKEIKALQTQIYQESLKKKVKTKVGKKTVTTGGPNQTLLKQWRHRLSDVRHDLSGQKSLLSKDTGLLGNFQGDLTTGRHDLRFNAFDIRDNVNSDEYRLRGELADIDPGALQHQVDVNNQGLTASGGAGAGGAGNPDLQALLAALTQQLAQANLALGVQGIQIPLIGAFERGTIHVPETGPYLLHAGEKVTQNGVPAGIGGDGVVVSIEHNYAPGMEWLQRFVDSRVVVNSSEISIAQGQETSRRLRGGRF